MRTVLFALLLLTAVTGCATNGTHRLPSPGHWEEGGNVFTFDTHTLIHYRDSVFKIHEYEYRYHADDFWIVEDFLARNPVYVRIRSGDRNYSREILEKIIRIGRLTTGN